MARIPIIRFIPGSTTLVAGRKYWYVYEGVRYTLIAKVSGKPGAFSHSLFNSTSPQTLWYETVEQAELFNPTLFPGDRVRIKTGQRVVNTEDSPRTYLQLTALPVIETLPVHGFINSGFIYEMEVHAPFIADGYKLTNLVFPYKAIYIGKIEEGSSTQVTVIRKRLNPTMGSNDNIYIYPNGYPVNWVTPPASTQGDTGLFLSPQVLDSSFILTFENVEGTINVTKNV